MSMRRPGGRQLLVLGLLVAFAGCKKKPAKAPALYSQAELDTLKQGLLGRLDKARTQTCPRAPLRGSASAGPADSDLLALLEPSGDLASCNDLLKGPGGQAASEALKSPLGSALPAELAEVPRACAGVGAAVQRAAAHEDACSPYLLGRHQQGSFLAFIALAKATALQARTLAANGKAAEALHLLMDLARISQDVSRGGAPLLHSMVGTATLGIAARAMSSILASEAALTDPELESLSQEVAALLATEPDIAAMMHAEVDMMALTGALPVLVAPDFTPPGGWPEGLLRVSAKEVAPLDVNDYAGLFWTAIERWPERFVGRCGAESTLADCMAGMADASADVEDDMEPFNPTKMLKLIKGEISLKAMRENLVGAMSSVTPALGQFVKKLAQRSVQLGRVQVELGVRRRLLVAGATCPTVADFGAPPLATLLVVPRLGAPLVLEARPGGLAVLGPPALGKPPRAAIAEPLVTCPLTKLGAAPPPGP